MINVLLPQCHSLFGRIGRIWVKNFSCWRTTISSSLITFDLYDHCYQGPRSIFSMGGGANSNGVDIGGPGAAPPGKKLK